MIPALGSRPFRSRIGRRLIFAIVLFSSCITLIATSAQLYGDYRHDLDTIHDYLGVIRSSYLESLTDSVWTYDDITLQHQLDGLVRLPDMERLEIRVDGNIRWAAGEKASEHHLAEEFPLVHRYRGQPVALGRLSVQASLDQVYGRLFHTVLRTLAVNAFKTFLVAGFALLLFQLLVTRHLVALAGHLEAVDLDDAIPPFQLHRPATKPGELDELDQVTSAINRLQENLESAFDDLRQSEERFRTSFEEAVTGMAVVGLDGRFLRTNPALQALLGYSEQELEALSFQAVTLPEDLPAGETFVRQALAGETLSITFEKRYVTKGGDTVHAAVSSRVVCNDQGTARHFVSQIQDITARTRLEEQLRQAQKMEAIGTLAGGIAHDFNNILGAIIGYTELTLALALPGSEIEENLTEVLKAAHRAKDLTWQILSFSRSGVKSRTSLRLSTVVREAAKMLAATIPKTIDFQVEVTAEEAAMVGDAPQIQQIVMNLCTNAYHAMKITGGQLRVQVATEDVDRARAELDPNLGVGPHVVIRVTDTGPGMEPNL